MECPHALGEKVEKHMAKQKPRNLGVNFTIIRASEYRFLWVDVGSFGSLSDAQIFNHF